ncbi:hypothetical protein CkaCkLH20_00580 [Colletotrichum karsti]|uniref:Extracellular membrane protein CFEM domain-containing protein n=1 Tax=Colletotrichum karsti TaxID=1095194 RepID=A0A9P6IEM3_9PEZI|nr:uncharacterized protein CkaCkLH20_00580 [Colletotrichum karsti]KAF9881434.1 hypothetical protein CkaCkLH20_00580 [Colletotrichum karsti]
MQFTAVTAALLLAAFASTASALPTTRRDAITIPFMNEDCLRTCAVTCASNTGVDLETCATQICDCFDKKAYIDANPFEFHQFGAQIQDSLTGRKPGQFTKAQKSQLGLVEDKKKNNNKKEEEKKEKPNPVPSESVDEVNKVKTPPVATTDKVESAAPTMTKRPARTVEAKETGAPVAEKKKEDETRVLEEKTKESEVKENETRALEEDKVEAETRALKDQVQESEDPCDCGKKCNAEGVCVCNECVWVAMAVETQEEKNESS